MSADRNGNERQQITACPGTVFGFGKESATASETYAVLTGRRHQICEAIDQITASCHDVVICTSERISAHLMHRLYVEWCGAGVPGLICGPTPNMLIEICRKQAFKLIGQRQASARRVFVHPLLDFASINRGMDLLIGGTQPAEALRSALSSGASVLSVFGHSDGIDLTLSQGHFACPFAEGAPSGSELTPPCLVQKQCIRFPAMPALSKARQDGWIMPLEIFRADVGLIYACRVLRVRDGIIDPAYALVPALLRQGDLGVLITTWRKERGTIDGSHLNGLINHLCTGEMTGIAVQAFNRSEFATEFGVKLCLIGDPCFSISPNESFSRLPEAKVTRGTKVEVESSRSSVAANVKLLRESIQQALTTTRFFDVSKGKDLISELSALEKSSADLVDPIPSGAGKIELKMLEFLSAFPWLETLFGQFATIASLEENKICPSCAAPARVLLVRFPRHGAKPRRIVRCACCDDSSSFPIGWEVALGLNEIDQGLITLTGVPENTQVVVCLNSLWGSLYESYVWPAPPDGRWVFRLPQRVPLTPIYCQILLVHRFEIAALGFRVRKLSDDKYHTPLKQTISWAGAAV